MPQVSAGLVLFRRRGGEMFVLLGHPGGPMWRNRDAGAWTIPKGQANAGEALLAAARREFGEETGLHPTGPFVPLGSVKLKSGKQVHAWAAEGDCDPACLHSNTCEIEWPPRSGRRLEVPELDGFGWFSAAEAREKMNPAQTAMLDELEKYLRGDSG